MILRHYKPPHLDLKSDPQYLAWIRMNSCAVCWQWKLRPARDRNIEAAHVGKRGLGQKCSDRETIPLCIWHHRTGPHSHHALGKRFWNFWKLDRIETIRKYQEKWRRHAG